MLTGDNGILKMAGKAKEQTEIAGEKEQIQLAYTALKMTNLDKRVSSEELLTELIDEQVDVASVEGNNVLTILMNNNNIYEINNNEEIDYIGKNLPSNNKESLLCVRNEQIAFWQEAYRTKITKIETKPYIAKYENTIKEWDVSNKKDKSVIATIKDDGNDGYILYISGNEKIKCESLYRYFENFENVTSINLEYFDTSNVRYMGFLFHNCKKLSKVNITLFDTSNVIDIDGMFLHCAELKDLDVSNFNTNNIGSARNVFAGCSKLQNLNLGGWELPNATRITGMFNGCSSIKSLDLNNINTSNVYWIDSMFTGCSNLESLNISNWDISKVDSLYGMFADCSNLKILDLSKWDTSSVTEMREAFKGCKNLTTLGTNVLDLSNVQRMFSAFSDCNNLSTGVIISDTTTFYERVFDRAATNDGSKIIVYGNGESSTAKNIVDIYSKTISNIIYGGSK